jgi:hypothetical protein
MKIEFNERTKTIEYVLSDKDIKDAREIFLTTQSPGWKVLESYYKLGREEIIESGKRCSRTRAKKELCSERFAMLDGFDQAILVPSKVVRDAETYANRERQEKREDKKSGRGTDYDQY